MNRGTFFLYLHCPYGKPILKQSVHLEVVLDHRAFFPLPRYYYCIFQCFSFFIRFVSRAFSVTDQLWYTYFCFFFFNLSLFNLRSAHVACTLFCSFPLSSLKPSRNVFHFHFSKENVRSSRRFFEAFKYKNTAIDKELINTVGFRRWRREIEDRWAEESVENEVTDSQNLYIHVCKKQQMEKKKRRRRRKCNKRRREIIESITSLSLIATWWNHVSAAASLNYYYYYHYYSNYYYYYLLYDY